MKVEYEIINPDERSSFRTLYLDLPTSELEWQYHYHPEIELVCVLGGSGTRHVGYHKSNFENGDLVLIGSNVPHSGFGLNSTDPHREIVVQVKEDILIGQIREIVELKKVELLLKKSKYGILFGHKTKKEITEKLTLLMKLNGHQKYLLMLEIFCHLSECEDYQLLNDEIMPHSIITKHKKRIEDIFTFVEEHYYREININEVAEIANLSLPAFCNFFKKTTKMTFTEFVNKYRINKACLLISQDRSISEACYESGFNNVTYFNRIFKQFTEKTPTEFKKNNAV